MLEAPSTLATFRGDLLAALDAALTSRGTFACLASIGRTPIEIERLRNGRVSLARAEASIEGAFDFDASTVIASEKRVFASKEIWPHRSVKILGEPCTALLLFLHHDAVLYGLAGAERMLTDATFSSDDRRMLEAIAPLLSCAAMVARGAEEHERPWRACGAGGPGKLGRLSPREAEIARLLAAGYSAVNIAARFALSPNTIRKYIQRVHTKLGVCNRAELVREVLR
jgi:DNA-binding CsgD family transcriptional regulator